MQYEVDSFEEMARALRKLAEYLRQLNIEEDTIFDSRLISSELLTNVLKHSTGKAFFASAVRDGCIELEVDGEESFVPPDESVCSPVTSESGRGYFLIDSFCEKRVVTDSGVKVFIRIEKKN